VDTAELKRYCIGLDVYKARNRILHLCPEITEPDIDITFRESPDRRFVVTDCTYDTQRRKVMLFATSKNPIRHLPSNYQENDFLRNFLMIFQHMDNRLAITLDNVHELFRPMDCPSSFLPVLADWFGVNLDTIGGETEIRRYLQYAIPLYRYRGTSLGIRAHLAIVSGIVPEIIEGSLPFGAMEILDGTDVDSHIFEPEESAGFFTVYFPVTVEEFDAGLVRRLSRIIQNEKPAHTKCYLCFKRQEKKPRDITILKDSTILDGETGIQF
jgi:phage tail-like protein